MIGVPYELFWKLNPRKLKPFEAAYKMKLDREQDMINAKAWVNGLYVQMAIGSCFSKNSKYPESPLGMGKEEQPEKKEIESSNKAGLFLTWALKYNENFENKHKSESQ